MFVDVEDFKGAIGVENILIPYKKGQLAPDKKSRLPKEPITPQVCMEILKSTNYARNIKDMLECIADLPKAQQAQFKDVVLATFDNREQPTNIWELGAELAKAHGYLQELEKKHKLTLIEFLVSAPNGARGFYNSGSKYDSKINSTLQNVEKFLNENDKLTTFYQVKLPKILECPNALAVHLYQCDMSGCQQIICKDDAKIAVWGTQQALMPQKVDVSSGAKLVVEVDKVDLIDGWNFNRDKLCGQADGYAFDGKVDFSRFSELEFDECSFENCSEAIFKPNSSLRLHNIETLPENMDFGVFSDVFLEGVDLSQFEEIKFAKGAKCEISVLNGHPKVLDVSQCAELNLFGVADSNPDKDTDFSIIFKNQEQMQKSNFWKPHTWKGKIIFADEQSQADLNLAMMTAKTKGGR